MASCYNYYFHSPFQYSNRRRSSFFECPNTKLFNGLRLRAYNRDEDGDRRGFLSIEEAGLVEISGLDTHERFLARLTISSLNLLRVIAEQEGCRIEELNAGKICDWFFKDKLKREQNIGSAVLQWEDDDPLDLHL